MEYDLGKYEVVSMHKNCRHKGSVMRITPLKINGHKIPESAPNEWFWCNGKTWNPQEQIWEKCGASSLTGGLDK